MKENGYSGPKSKWTSQEKKVETISKCNSTDIRKWFKKKETSKIATIVSYIMLCLIDKQ